MTGKLRSKQNSNASQNRCGTCKSLQHLPLRLYNSIHKYNKNSRKPMEPFSGRFFKCTADRRFSSHNKSALYRRVHRAVDISTETKQRSNVLKQPTILCNGPRTTAIAQLRPQCPGDFTSCLAWHSPVHVSIKADA